MAKKTTRILMCPPDYFTVVYEINPWMDAQAVVDTELAREQWQNLYDIVIRLGIQVELKEAHPDLPDHVFIDAGFLYKNVFVPSNFRFPERQLEAIEFANWFEGSGYEIRQIDSELYFEGHGDDLWVDENTVYCGYGFRSRKVSFEHIRQALADVGQIDMKLIELIDPRLYHLDTCFTPLRKDLGLIYRPGIAPDSIKLIELNMELIELSEEDAFAFACNSLVLGDHIIMPAASKELQKKLHEKGFHVHIVNVSEFIKAGGACKCMCMQL